MRTSFKQAALAILLFCGFFQTASAGQEIYLSESPNAKFRVVVHQEIFRQVGEKPFFHYPITVWNLRNRRSFNIHDGGLPFIRETEKGTFTIHWESVHFDWSKDSRYFFMTLEVMPNAWKTFFGSVEKGKARDVTDELKGSLLDKISRRAWACEPAKITLDHWFNPFIAVFRVTSDCGSKRDEENNKLFKVSDWEIYDAKKQKIAKGCMECDAKEAEKKAWEYFQFTRITPTPTPVPEETPGASQ